uniref:Uncharacterized protein n=1 Tax=Anguilla anguilla TaxID=7936 RepID=A0A0E9Q0D7_ANGAN
MYMFIYLVGGHSLSLRLWQAEMNSAAIGAVDPSPNRTAHFFFFLI